MVKNNIATAESYYRAMGNKDLASLGRYLHPKIQFIGPLATITGKEGVLEGVKRIFQIFNGLEIRAKFVAGDQVMVVYDSDCLPPIGILHVAALLTFQDDLISRMELFYDARPFEKK